jgi:hypothetical protein
MAKLPKPVPFLYMSQKAATSKYLDSDLIERETFKKITVEQTVFPCGMLRASFFAFLQYAIIHRKNC